MILVGSDGLGNNLTGCSFSWNGNGVLEKENLSCQAHINSNSDHRRSEDRHSLDGRSRSTGHRQ